MTAHFEYLLCTFPPRHPLFITARTAFHDFHHCTFSCVTAHFLHHCTL